MFNKIKRNLGNFDFLKNKKSNQDLYAKRLLSLEFRDMPFFRYAVLMASLLNEEFFFRTLIIGKAQRQYDLTWLLKDFSAHLDFVSNDFSGFELEPDLFKEVNFIKVDQIWDFQTEHKYDLIIVIENYDYFTENQDRFYSFISSLTISISSRVIFILNYHVDTEKKQHTPNLKLSQAFIKTFEIKNYDKGLLKQIDFIIATRGIALK